VAILDLLVSDVRTDPHSDSLEDFLEQLWRTFGSLSAAGAAMTATLNSQEKN